MLWPLPGEPQWGHAALPEGSLQLTRSGVPGEVPNVNRAGRHVLPCLRLRWVTGSSGSAWGSCVWAAGFHHVLVLILKGDVFPSLLLSGAEAPEYRDSPHHLVADLKK